MRSSVFGAVLGACVAALALTIWADLPSAPARAELIAKWGQLRPGMTRNDTVHALRSPPFDFKPDGGYPEWAQLGSPGAFSMDHGLLVFTITRMGPQLLLVYLDRDDKVVFVSSTSTAPSTWRISRSQQPSVGCLPASCSPATGPRCLPMFPTVSAVTARLSL